MSGVILIFGPPGSGKGTQGDLLADSLGVKKISTGDIFRRNVSEGTELGKKVEAIINSGNLVSDDILAELVESELEANSSECILLDGYPRTLVQADDFRSMKAFNKVITALYLDVSEEHVTSRMLGRRVCTGCAHTYNVSVMKTEKEGVCDRCQAPLMTREDDSADKVKARLAIYKEKTLPVLNFFKEHSFLERINGEANPTEVCLEITNKLSEIKKRDGNNC